MNTNKKINTTAVITVGLLWIARSRAMPGDNQRSSSELRGVGITLFQVVEKSIDLLHALAV